MLGIIIEVQILQFLGLGHDQIDTLLAVIVLHIQGILRDLLGEHIIFRMNAGMIEHIMIFFLRRNLHKPDRIDVDILAHQLIDPQLHAVLHLAHLLPQRIQYKPGLSLSQSTDKLQRRLQMRELNHRIQIHAHFVDHLNGHIFIGFLKLFLLH